ncbi:ABC transporter substrate-binding protein [Lusitaniella coriacea]|uniref:ABC transporter substrate-binding protein n=1 Tax=Lusitaniella coriacea TaxID=1983105 RepID=UPI001D144A68|nr:iron-siderophore ABC transporter substrate-binding protein [Lusitaniella coriacea]
MTRWLVLSVLTAGLVIGCGFLVSNNLAENPVVDSSDCRTVKHDLGEAKVCGQPQKIAVLSGHALDLLLSLDVQPAGYVGPLSIYQGKVFDNPALQIPYLGTRIASQPVHLGMGREPSLEKLLALKPDLILGEGRNADEYDLLAKISPTLLWRNRTAKGQWQKNLRAIAEALGQEKKAEVAIARYESRIANARSDFADVVAAHPKLLLLGASRLGMGVYAIRSESYLGELLEGIGFQVLSAPSSELTPSTPVSLEALPDLDDADTIIILGYNLDDSDGLEIPDSSTEESISDRVEKHQTRTIQQDWEENAIAQSLTASKEGRVYFATYAKWNGLNGPIGAELVLEQLREFLLDN